MPNFEQTPFPKKEIMETENGKIKIEDINPEKGEQALPIFFAPGWSRTIETYQKSLEQLAKEDRRVISLEHPRFSSHENNEPKKFEDEINSRALNIIDTIKEKDIKKINLVGQSMGGADAVITAILAQKEDPELIKNIVLVDPSGIIGEDNIKDLGKRFVENTQQNIESQKKEEASEYLKKNVKIAAKEFFKYVFKNPAKALREIKAMTSQEILDVLAELKKRGVGISIIHGVDDKVFPMERVQEEINTKHLDGFYSVKGGHNEIYQQPEKYMPLVREAIRALEAKQEKK